MMDNLTNLPISEKFLADLSDEITLDKQYKLAYELNIQDRVFQRIREKYPKCDSNFTFHILYEWKKTNESLPILLKAAVAAGCKEEDFKRILGGTDNYKTETELNGITQKLNTNKLKEIDLGEVECQTIANYIGHKYWLLGIQLGVPETTIQYMHRMRWDTKKLALHILLKWCTEPKGQTNREINEDLIRAMVKSHCDMTGVLKIFGQSGSDLSQSYNADNFQQAGFNFSENTMAGATGTQQSGEILYARESASLQQGANREGDDMMDAAPTDDSSSRNQQVKHEQQMQRLEMHEPFPPTIVNKTETYCEDIADGRVIDVDGKALERVIKEGIKLQSGSTGEVYCSKEIIKQWGFRIVVKKIPCTEFKLQSVVNEIVAARMKHQGIVPLLAKTNYKDHAYFVFPYMENGDLMNAIREDMERITKQENVHMGARQRVLILYQIACAMCFIHTPVKDFSYSRTADWRSTKKGVWELKKEPLDFLMDYFANCYKSVWEKIEKDQSVYTKLKNLADKCLNEEMDSKSLAESLYEILSDVFNFNWEGDDGSVEETGESKKQRCSLCIINWAVVDLHNLRLDVCVSKKKHISPPVCVPCMRNSYLNPIMCRTCRNTIHTNIGNSMAAILVEGFAKDEDEDAFKNDVKSMENILTSKYPLAFGLDPANVIISSTKIGLSDAMDKLNNKADIATIFIYYSGHYSKMEGFSINSQSNLKMEDFSNDLEHIDKDIILVLDCCEAGSIKVEPSNVVLQMNSSRSNEVSTFNKHDSIFTKFFIQAAKNVPCPGQCRICKDYKPDSLHKGFISREQFFYYIYEHMEGVGSTPTMIDKKEKGSHFHLGYHITGKREITFHLKDGNDDCTIGIRDLPYEMSELRNLLLQEILKNKFRGDERSWSDYWKDNEKRWQNFSDTLRVRITKGPRPEDKSELIGIPKVVDAWNKKFELEFGFRDEQNIEKGNVGMVLIENFDTQQIVDMFQTKRDHYKDCLEFHTVDKQTKLTVLCDTFYKKEHSDDPEIQWLKKTVLDIIRNQKLQDHQRKKLIITILPELRNERFPLTERFLMMEIPKRTSAILTV